MITTEGRKKESDHWFCRWFFHSGPIVNSGAVVVTSKKNKPIVQLPGRWFIRKCRRCGEKFSGPTDLIDKRNHAREVCHAVR